LNLEITKTYQKKTSIKQHHYAGIYTHGSKGDHCVALALFLDSMFFLFHYRLAVRFFNAEANTTPLIQKNNCTF
jgi:hypothetical protein